MTRTWEFSDVEFVVRWSELGEGRLPSPLFALGRTLMADDADRERREILRRIHSNPDPTFHNVLETVARPDIRIEVDGMDPRKPDDPERAVRMLAVRKGFVGYLVRQKPGETTLHSGGFTVVECDATDLADVIVGELPAVGAGTRGDVALVAKGAGLDYGYGQRVINDAYDDPVQDQSADLLSADMSGLGRIRVSQGVSAFGPRGRKSYILTWRDVVGDGRYVTAVSDTPVALAADGRRAAYLINTQIAEIVQTIKDERRSTAR